VLYKKDHTSVNLYISLSIFFRYLPSILLNLRNWFAYISILTAVTLFCSVVSAQYTVRGAVYDSSRLYAMPYVTVSSTSGKSTFTDANGNYQIPVSQDDSIWFSYLGKPTVKFPVKSIFNPLQFDISIQVNVTTLQEVKVRQRNYRQDSIMNRQEYADIFNYRKPGLRTVTPQGGTGVGVGFDLREIINMFRFRRNRTMNSFQQRLLQQERDKFIDHRFSRGLVIRLTKLTSPELDSFMLLYRPSYTFTQMAGDYDFQLYIKKAFERFQAGLRPEEWDEYKILEDN